MLPAIATVELRAPPTYLHHAVATIITIHDSPLSTIPSPRTVVLPTGAEIFDIPAAHSTQPTFKSSEMECVQPLPVVVEEDVQNEEISNRAVEVAQTKPRAEVQASSSVVNVIPLDCHN